MPPRLGRLNPVLIAIACVTTPLAIRSIASSQTVPSPPAPGARVVTYEPSTESFPNPERGFSRVFEPFGVGAERSPLEWRELVRLREEGLTLIATYIIIDEFLDAPLSRAMLDGLAADFLAASQAGVKVIPRFTYNFPCRGQLEPCDDATMTAQGLDPPLSRVLEHIDQLTPVLRAASDVIAFMEMGFVGAWGEWHHSSSRLINRDSTLNASSAAIVARVLYALPDNRMAALRTPFQKQSLFGRQPLGPADAFNGTPRSRVGAHNDCFLASPDDFGTYWSPLGGRPEDNIEAFKTFLNLDNRYVPQGGETCSTGAQAEPYIHCPNALRELARMRWSTIDVDFHPGVIDLWRREGCFADVHAHLGYRLRLVTAEVPAEVSPGGPLNLRVHLVNDGWAAPFNPRGVELILRHAITHVRHTFPVAVDPRFWLRGPRHTIDIRETLSTELDAGSYEVLLNLYDPEPGLARRAEYSIRLANADVWEAQTGYNNLLADVTVVPQP